MAGFTRLSFLLLILSGCLFAQTGSDCREQTLVATALDSHSLPVNNLATVDFKVSFRGASASVKSAQYRMNPGGRVIVLLDVSGSMRGRDESNKWKIAHAMASEFVSLAPPTTQISFMSFAGTVQKRFGASGGRKPIQEWLSNSSVREGLQVKGETALYETIFAAIKELGAAEPGDSIYVITDAEDNFSKAKSSDVERLLINSGIRLFALILYEPARHAESEEGSQRLNDLVRRSGGLLLSFSAHLRPSGGDYYEYNDKVVNASRDATRLVQAQISNFYVLNVVGPDQPSNPKDWNLQVVDAQGCKRNDISVSYTRPSLTCVQPAVQ